MKVVAVIPARLEAKRFPRKVLARETGKYLFQHVYERVVGCPGIDRVIVATDSREVAEAGSTFGAEVQLTRSDHVSGTDRVAEVARSLDHDIVLNVQADEPLVEHEDLQTLIALFAPAEEPLSGTVRPLPVMSTLAAARRDARGFRDANVVKVVIGRGGDAVYFSRAPVPYAHADESASTVAEWFQHIGLYAYERDFLLRLAEMAPTALEQRERLEQMRVLENGYRIRVGLTLHRHVGVDTEEEYKEFVEQYRAAQVYPDACKK